MQDTETQTLLGDWKVLHNCFLLNELNDIHVQPVVLNSSHLHGHTLRFHSQAQKLETPCTTS